MSPSSRHDLSKAQLDFRFEADGHGTLSQGDHEWLGAAVDSHLGHGHGAETAMEKTNGKDFPIDCSILFPSKCWMAKASKALKFSSSCGILQTSRAKGCDLWIHRRSSVIQNSPAMGGRCWNPVASFADQAAEDWTSSDANTLADRALVAHPANRAGSGATFANYITCQNMSTSQSRP